MNTLEAIAARRSIRKFKNTVLEGKKLDAILLAAAQAPSGKNRQPWRFIVVKEGKRAEMVRILKEGIADSKSRGRKSAAANGRRM